MMEYAAIELHPASAQKCVICTRDRGRKRKRKHPHQGVKRPPYARCALLWLQERVAPGVKGLPEPCVLLGRWAAIHG